MRRIVVIAHAPSPNTQRLRDAVLRGIAHPDIDAVEGRWVAPLEAGAEDVLSADAVILGTPENLGYMSGALKHAFDTTYNDALNATRGRPYGVLVHGESDTEGALLGIRKIVAGLAWRAVAEPVSVIGSVEGRLDDCRELGAVVAASTLGY